MSPLSSRKAELVPKESQLTSCEWHGGGAKEERMVLVEHCLGCCQSVIIGSSQRPSGQKPEIIAHHKFPRLSWRTRLFALFEGLFVWKVDGGEASASEQDSNRDALCVHTDLHDLLGGRLLPESPDRQSPPKLYGPG